MSERSLEAMIASPPEREELVVQLFEKDGGQWGEVFREAGRLQLEIYERADGQPWQLDLDEVETVLRLGRTELLERLQ